jgi:phosphatidylserine/phosphatidylglycerophosphate/cardiolipin synthase-like enzyme
VLRAIVYEKAETWNEVRDKSDLTQKQMLKVIKELRKSGSLDYSEVNGEKRFQILDDALCRAYQSAKDSDDNERAITDAIPDKKTESHHMEWIQSWIEQDDVNASLESSHFFLEGKELSYITRRLMERAQSTIMVVNPFVDRAGLSTAFRDAIKKGVKGLLITRYPDDSKEEFHQTLTNAGCDLRYSGSVGGVHSKIVVIDEEVAIVSSMNFTKNAEAAVSHETGIVSLDKDVVESVLDSIRNLRDQDETKLA